MSKKFPDKYDRCPCKRRWKKKEAETCRACFKAKTVVVENNILRLLATGMNHRQAASALWMSRDQIKEYFSRIRARFKTRSEFKIALLAREAGIV